jgi:hypothetical protein
MDAYLLRALQAWQPQLNLLQTLPGVDRIGAAMLLVEIGADIGAFGSAERLASWVRICPGNNESAGKRKTGHAQHRHPLHGQERRSRSDERGEKCSPWIRMLKKHGFMDQHAAA